MKFYNTLHRKKEDFQPLEKGKVKKQKISKDIKKRGVLLAKYKKAVVDLKSSIKKQKEKELYDKIKKKK